MSGEFNLKLDGEALSQLASAQILAQLTAEEKKGILEQAVRFLLTPQRGNWGSGKTPLQDAFEMAIKGTAVQVARGIIEGSPEIQERVRQMVAEAYEIALVERRDATVQLIAESITAAMRCHRD